MNVQQYQGGANFVVSNSTVLCEPLSDTALIQSTILLTLNGTATNQSTVSVTPTESQGLQFGSVPCGQTANAITVTVKNTGASDISFSASLSLGTAYQLSATTGTVAANGGQTSLVVTPNGIPNDGTASFSAGFYNDTLTITDSSEQAAFNFSIPIVERPSGAYLTINTSNAFIECGGIVWKRVLSGERRQPGEPGDDGLDDRGRYGHVLFVRNTGGRG